MRYIDGSHHGGLVEHKVTNPHTPFSLDAALDVARFSFSLNVFHSLYIPFEAEVDIRLFAVHASAHLEDRHILH